MYKECLAIKPTDTYVQGQIALIEQELNKQKEQADQFNKLVAEGDVAMNSKIV
ncbi:MAG: hypothetical protein IPM74_19665 [Crocinitomicaceae bacterium]|nr:hypothetical protein [Crocinitomicaceae bacterium]